MAYFNEKTREATIEQLAGAIKALDKKHVKDLRKLGVKRDTPKEKDGMKYKYDAKAYLENNQYDFQIALAQCKNDLAREIMLA